MADKSKLVEEMRRTINQSGGGALEIAKNEITSKFASDDDVCLALKYFAKVTLRNALPVFPALISISCEAVGGNPDNTKSTGGAITLIAGAADLHDDVIDQSPVKNGKRTTFGKFGKDVTILAGDVLLVLGLTRLQKECESIPREQGSRVMDLLTHAILEISHAEALEAKLRAEKTLSVEACMKVIELKAVVPEVNMKIGAVLGNGSAESVEALGHFGKAFGIVSTVAEEFMDVLEFEELRNRLRNDYPPMPFVCALQDPKLKAQVLSLKEKLLAEKRFEALKTLILNSPETIKLEKDMRVLVQTEVDSIYSVVRETETRKKLELLLNASLELLEGISS